MTPLTPRTLKPEYGEVRFRCAVIDPPSSFFIITAHNPDGVKRDDAANRQADERFLIELERHGFAAFTVTGGSPDFSHSEAGYGIVCAREEALCLATLFRQDAIFEVCDGRVILLSALPSGEPDKEIGLWSELAIA